MSKRTDIANHMAKTQGHTPEIWLGVIYDLEKEGYQVVKNSETAEFQGLRNAKDG